MALICRQHFEWKCDHEGCEAVYDSREDAIISGYAEVYWGDQFCRPNPPPKWVRVHQYDGGGIVLCPAHDPLKKGSGDA